MFNGFHFRVFIFILVFLMHVVYKAFDLKMLKSETSWSEARPQGICSTCLAVDRQLFALQKTPELFDIVIGLALPVTGMVCFECRARLVGFVKFRNRALSAYKVLSCLPPNGTTVAQILHTFSSTGVKCLSTLTQTAPSPYDTIYVDGDSAQVKSELLEREIRVKQEMLEQEFVIVEPVVEPYFVSIGDSLKTEGDMATGEDPKTDRKPKEGDDEEDKSDTASESGEAKPQKDQIDFVVKQIDRSEVLAYLERERGSQRYKRAPYKCDKCAVPFLLEQKLKKHNILHSEKRGPLKCEICERRFKSSAVLKQHTNSHYKQYGCPQCARVDCSYNKMHSHYKKVHDDTTPRACRKCPARFTTAKDLRIHMRSLHDKYICKLCDRQYTTKLSLDRHMIFGHTKVRQLECDICHKKYKGEANLKVHIRKSHENPRKDEPREDAYCAECNIHFCDPQSYRMHLRTARHIQTDDFKHWCDHCGKRYTQKTTLIVHIEEQHLKLSRYKCKVCDERFHSNVYRLRHTRIKHSDKPRVNKHVCEVCAKAFVLRKSLEDHMNTHLGVRPYECLVCGATFAYSAALYNHNQLVHLKKKLGKRKNT